MGTFREDLEKTHASAMFQHAINPAGARHLSRAFGGAGLSVTKEDVKARFGDEAARAWQDARDAKARYFAAIRARTTGEEQ